MQGAPGIKTAFAPGALTEAAVFPVAEKPSARSAHHRLFFVLRNSRKFVVFFFVVALVAGV